jgi:type IV pilus assembly protein PilX
MYPIRSLTNAKRQTGVVLVVALVMLLLITIVGMSSIRSLTLEERMTANSIDRNAVFQATEWGLSLAEQVAENQAKQCNGGFHNRGVAETPVNPAATGVACVQTPCQNGLCSNPQPNCPPRWEDSNFNGWATVKDPSDATKNLVTPSGVSPRFFIEYLNTTKPVCIGKPSDGPFSYRVTVQTHAGEGRSSVTLQSIYSDQ